MINIPVTREGVLFGPDKTETIATFSNRFGGKLLKTLLI
jgi:hypothetical protein